MPHTALWLFLWFCFSFIHGDVLSAYMPVLQVHASQKPKVGGVQCPGTEVIGGCEPSVLFYSFR